MRLVYIGPEGRLLAAAGIAVEVRPTLAEVEGDADVVGIDARGGGPARARFPRARGVARVMRREESAPALAGAGDAVGGGRGPWGAGGGGARGGRPGPRGRRPGGGARPAGGRGGGPPGPAPPPPPPGAPGAARRGGPPRRGTRRSFGEALAWGLEFAARHAGA